MKKNKEKEHKVLFSKSFSWYGAKQINNFTQPFQSRFFANSTDASSVFEGKQCLDARFAGTSDCMFMHEGLSHHFPSRCTEKLKSSGVLICPTEVADFNDLTIGSFHLRRVNIT